MTAAYAHPLGMAQKCLDDAVLHAPDGHDSSDLIAVSASLTRLIAEAERQPPPQAEPDPPDDTDYARGRQEAQRRRLLPTWEREQVVLDALSTDALTIREIAEKAAGQRPDLGDLEPMIRSAVARMFAGRELRRHPEPWQGRTRYRYYRNLELAGPIADLDRRVS